MNVLKWFLSMALIAFVGLVIVGFLLPREISATRTIRIAAAPMRVFTEIETPRRARDWLPVGVLDGTTEYSFSGPDAGVGAMMKWSNPEFRDYGRGQLSVVGARAGERVEYALDLEKMGAARMQFELAQEGTGTRLSWTISTRLGGSPFARWIGLLLDDWLAEDIEKGLAGLKAKLETDSGSGEGG